MTTDNQTNGPTEAQIEAAAEYLYDWQTGSVGYFHTSNHKELWIHGARQALAAALGLTEENHGRLPTDEGE